MISEELQLIGRITPERDEVPSTKSWSVARGFILRRRYFLAFVVMPVLVAVIYYGLIASDQYFSEGSFIVKSPGQQGGQVSTLANLIQTTGLSRGQEETNAVLDYIRSRNALEELQKRIDARSMFMGENVDRLSRYPFPLFQDRFENLYDYYRDKVEVYLDTETGMAVLSVKAFSAADAHTISSALLSLSEEFVNRLNERAHEQAIVEGKRRVEEAESRILNAYTALTGFRNKQSLIDPQKQASGILEISTKLSAEKATLQARLDRMQKATPESPGISVLRDQIAAVSKEIDKQSRLIAGGDAAISSKLGNYEPLVLEQTFAAKMLESANGSLELARVTADKQQFYLQRVVEPNVPDLARYPRRLASILVVFGSALCLYFIGWMLLAGIREHAPDK